MGPIASPGARHPPSIKNPRPPEMRPGTPDQNRNPHDGHRDGCIRGGAGRADGCEGLDSLDPSVVRDRRLWFTVPREIKAVSLKMPRTRSRQAEHGCKPSSSGSRNTRHESRITAFTGLSFRESRSTAAGAGRRPGFSCFDLRTAGPGSEQARPRSPAP